MNEHASGRVAAVLAKARLSQGDFAERCGVSQPTISAIVKGHDVRLSTWLKVERAIAEIEREYDQRASA